ncbi:MAG: NAD(P)-dependent oxidoreductase [Gemmatimonadetes bacterium]|nr:NAD(P)-dependent oxidoreductase [Gemmatimonadota bacterium]
MRQLAATLPEERYEANFADLAPPLTPDQALGESSRCLFCYDAPCTTACPTHIDVPAFIKMIASGNLRGAAREILDANPMGHSCARACPVEVLCEGACVLNQLHKRPIEIARLQRYATDFALEHRLRLFEPGAATGRRVAVVGAGPAGLACAQDLRRCGHDVVIFEAREFPGGLNTYSIADYKMKPPTALAEARMVLDLGAELRTGVRVGEDVSFEELLEQYDAVFVGVGLGGTRRLGIPGESLHGVVDALSFIEELKLRPKREVAVGRRVVVVGAGNTAIDAATQAKRLGAERVTIVYRRTDADMPAYHYEYELAKADGCEFRWSTLPVRFVGNAVVEAVECVRTQSGRPLPGTEFRLDADMVVLAIGQEPRASLLARIPGVRFQNGRLLADPATGQTSNPRVFTGGDCANGGKEIVNAAADGKRAAAAIHALLRTMPQPVPAGG